MKTIKHTFIWLTLFSIAMGYLETSVVVYLRKLYYPDGFDFPLVPIEPSIAITEFWREAATIIMLWGVGVMAGRNKTEKFAPVSLQLCYLGYFLLHLPESTARTGRLLYLPGTSCF
jgi:hypothetical protein